jgi:hypothetical protein
MPTALVVEPGPRSSLSVTMLRPCVPQTGKRRLNGLEQLSESPPLT